MEEVYSNHASFRAPVTNEERKYRFLNSDDESSLSSSSSSGSDSFDVCDDDDSVEEVVAAETQNSFFASASGAQKQKSGVNETPTQHVANQSRSQASSATSLQFVVGASQVQNLHCKQSQDDGVHDGVEATSFLQDEDLSNL